MGNKDDIPFQQNLDIIQPLLENLSITYESWIKYVNSSGAYIYTPINKQQCNFCRWSEWPGDDFLSPVQASCRMGAAGFEHSPVSPFLSGVGGACFHPQCLWCTGYLCVCGIIGEPCTGDDA